MTGKKVSDASTLNDPIKNRIAKRVAQELQDGYVVNLGVGIPTLTPKYITDGKKIYIQSENGILGVGGRPQAHEEDHDLIDASRNMTTVIPGGCFFDSAESFAMIRGKHVDATVIGALQISETGDIANWSVPSRGLYGVGGAMDLVCGCKRVIAAMQHTDRDGSHKIIEKCNYPVTAFGVVDTVVTEYAVFKFRDKKMYLIDHTSDITMEQLKDMTGARFEIADEFTVRQI